MQTIESNPVKRWLTELEDEDKSRHTVRNYAGDLRLFQHWYEENTGESFDLGNVAPSDVRSYRNWLLNHSAKPASINRRLCALRHFFRWAKGLRIVAENPTERVRDVKRQRLAPKWLDKNELYRLLRLVERDGDRRNLAIVQVLRHTGLRASELADLRLGDVEIGERSGEVTVRGKGTKIRTVPLNADARRALRTYLDTRGTDQGPLFLNHRGESLTVEGVHDVVTKYAKLAGVHATPHTLRHTFAKSTLDTGADLVTVATLLGHSRLDTTAIYTQPGRRDLEKAVNRLSEE